MIDGLNGENRLVDEFALRMAADTGHMAKARVV